MVCRARQFLMRGCDAAFEFQGSFCKASVFGFNVHCNVLPCVLSGLSSACLFGVGSIFVPMPGVIICWCYHLFCFLVVVPFVVPERGLLFLSPSFKKPRFVGRLACCSVRSTLPESVGGSWALDFLRHPPVLKKDGCRLRPIAPAEPHHPQDLWGGRLRFH